MRMVTYRQQKINFFNKKKHIKSKKKTSLCEVFLFVIKFVHSGYLYTDTYN